MKTTAAVEKHLQGLEWQNDKLRRPSFVRRKNEHPHRPSEGCPRRPLVLGVVASEAGDEVVHFLLGLVLLVAVVFLEFADQRVLLASDERPIVVGQLAPFGLELSGELTPLA